jgi:hypothetical protein
MLGLGPLCPEYFRTSFPSLHQISIQPQLLLNLSSRSVHATMLHNQIGPSNYKDYIRFRGEWRRCSAVGVPLQSVAFSLPRRTKTQRERPSTPFLRASSFRLVQRHPRDFYSMGFIYSMGSSIILEEDKSQGTILCLYTAVPNALRHGIGIGRNPDQQRSLEFLTREIRRKKKMGIP